MQRCQILERKIVSYTVYGEPNIVVPKTICSFVQQYFSFFY
jgi:hypothetical protein